MAEVREMLSELAQNVPEATDWDGSIVDLLKILRLESSFGSRVTLWGDGLSIDEVAQAAGTIGYELMCALAPRVRVVEGDLGTHG